MRHHVQTGNAHIYLTATPAHVCCLCIAPSDFDPAVGPHNQVYVAGERAPAGFPIPHEPPWTDRRVG